MGQQAKTQLYQFFRSELQLTWNVCKACPIQVEQQTARINAEKKKTLTRIEMKHKYYPIN